MLVAFDRKNGFRAFKLAGDRTLTGHLRIVELAVDSREGMNVVSGLIGVDDLQRLSGLDAQNARDIFAAMLIERNRVRRRFKRGLRQSALDEYEDVLEFAVLHDHVVQEILSHAF